jgi:hypothetical protein
VSDHKGKYLLAKLNVSLVRRWCKCNGLANSDHMVNITDGSKAVQLFETSATIYQWRVVTS